MKSLKLNHNLAEEIKSGQRHTTWRLFDDKDLSVDDRVVLIDKVDVHDKDSWQAFGEALITQVVEKHLGNVDKHDFEHPEDTKTPEQVIKSYRSFYGGQVSLKTPVKIIYFDYFPYDAPQSFVGSAEINVPVVKATNLKVVKAKLYADGGSRGNPGPSSSGYVLLDEQDNIVADVGQYLGITTNNVAEYTALKLGLEHAARLQIREVDVHMDSLLVINQMKGIFKVRNRDLWPLHEAIKQIATGFKRISYTHVPRELNKLADAAVNRALDEHLKK